MFIETIENYFLVFNIFKLTNALIYLDDELKIQLLRILKSKSSFLILIISINSKKNWPDFSKLKNQNYFFLGQKDPK